MSTTDAPAPPAAETQPAAPAPLTEPTSAPKTGEQIRAPREAGTDPFERPFPEKKAEEATPPPKPDAEGDQPEPKADDDAPPPAEIKLEAPEGFDPQDVEEIAGWAKEAGLSQEQAEKLLAREVALREGRTEMLAQERVKWGEQLAADKEFGGEHVEKTRLGAAMALHELAPDFYAELKESGWIDYPPLVKFAARAATMLREPDHATPAPKSVETKAFDDLTPKEQYERLFKKSQYPGT